MELRDFCKKGVWFKAKGDDKPYRTFLVNGQVIYTKDRSFSLNEIECIIIDPIQKLILEKEFNGEKVVYERCVSCGIELKIPVDLPEKFRDEQNYFSGVGEVCKACKDKIYPGEEFEKEVW